MANLFYCLLTFALAAGGFELARYWLMEMDKPYDNSGD